MSALTLGSEPHSLLVLGQEWKQAAEGLMLWMEEKWPRVADERSQAGSNILQDTKWHEITKSELLASHRYMEDLQQVRVPMAGIGPSCSDSSTYFPACFYGAQSLKVLSASCASWVSSSIDTQISPEGHHHFR